MKKDRLENMVRGWLVGNFVPAVYKTTDLEFAVQHFSEGSYEEQHHHKIATEITVIVSGKAEMNGVTYMAGDIIVVEPNEATDFRAITETTTAVLKIPGALNDKYFGSK
ncbi:MAG: hypothetical protein JXR80_09025 [Deltaproteobacteria bacterium]|nr:hypothetical protein [Deltaproteobacteria bacterium]